MIHDPMIKFNNEIDNKINMLIKLCKENLYHDMVLYLSS